jgi:hypothetical protein
MTDIFEQARASVNRSTVERLFPGGEWRNGEYWLRSPLRADQTPGSFSISEDGLFNDFASGDRGDLVDWGTRSRHRQAEAARLIIEAGGNGHATTTRAHVKKSNHDRRRTSRSRRCMIGCRAKMVFTASPLSQRDAGACSP